MDAGVVTPENLTQVLRGLSQRRRQGVLELNLGERQLKILFVQGKIVEVLEAGIDPVNEVYSRLKAAGFVSTQAQGSARTYKDLFIHLAEADLDHGFIEENSFKRSIRHCVLDKLYVLGLDTFEGLNGAYYTFQVQMVDYEKEFAPSLSVGQLLLDLVALQTDGERFKSLFSEYSRIQKTAAAQSANFSEDEKIILMLITANGTSKKELEIKSLLSRYAFQEALMSMHERSLIVILEGKEPKATEETPANPLVSDSIFASLENSIDSVFDSEIETSANSKSAEEVILTAIPEPLTEVPRQEKIVRKGLILEDQVKPFANQSDSRPVFVPGSSKDSLYAPGITFRLLQANWVPTVIVTLFLIWALAVPVMFWGNAWQALKP